MLGELLGSLAADIRSLTAGPSGYPYGPYRYGTRQYWQWYATIYLPRYYSQQQIYQLLLRSPMYSSFGLPFPYNLNQYQGTGYPGPGTGYGYNQYQYGYNQYPYVDPFAQAQYTYQGAEQGAQACAAQGGIWDWFQQACGLSYGNSVVGQSGDLPNVVGQDKNSAIGFLNQLGYAVWLLNEDGYSGGVPQDYNPRRIQITVTNGRVSGQSAG